jgi:MFS family permease
MSAIASAPGALRVFVISLVARLPVTMLSIGLLVHARHLTGSFTAAGIVAGGYGVALGVGGPLLGKLVDRRGQTAVVVTSAAAGAVLLGAVAVLPVGVPAAVVVALACGIGLAEPPIGACVRTLFPGLLDDPAAVRAAYAADASASELTWVAGPPLVLGLGVAWSTGAALAVAGVVLLVSTVAFALQPASRAWRPEPATGPRPRGGSLQTPAMRTLVAVLVAVGVLFGAVEVAVTAAAHALGSTAAAGPLLGVWGAGSLIGGLLAARRGGGAYTPAGLALVLVGLTVGHFALTAATGSVLALAAVLLLAGTAIAPTYATVYAMVDHAAPAGTVTEAFAWLATAIAVGSSAGSAIAGSLADRSGPVAAFVLAGAAGAAAVLLALARSSTLAEPTAAAAAPA